MQVAWVAPNGCTPPLVLKACVALPSLLMGPRVHEWSAFGSFDGLLSNEENEYGTALDCSCDLEFLEQGKIVHGFMIKLGLELESDLLISLTAVCRYQPNVTLWNAMISGYAKNGYAEEAVKLFPKWMDYYIGKSEYRNNVIVNTVLIDMYAKCGSVDLAPMFFDRTLDKDVVMRSAMTVGYGLHGLGEEGWVLFHHIRKHGIEPRHQHYARVVDLLARAGYSNHAFKFIMNMPIEPRLSVRRALLSAWKISMQQWDNMLQTIRGIDEGEKTDKRPGV
ncbi:hypothetical protein AB3S75_009217 [Citrus x aurantiifolia]